MLILVAGLSGNLGKYLAEYGIENGHQIRGFGRSPSKVPDSLLKQLESFVECEHYDDRATLKKAVTGVDAVICCYAGHPTAVLEAQLSLVRAVEEAGIKVYHAHSWNYDWTKIRFEDWEHYDTYIAFHRYVQLTSSIKPVYTFTGLLGELATNEHFGIAHLKDSEDGKTLAHWGTGDEKWSFTYLRDIARFTIDLLTTNQSVLAGNGGYFSIHSGEASAKDLAQAYEKVKGEKVKLKSLGGVTELQESLKQARATTDPRQYFYYSHYFLQAATLQGIWKLTDPVVVGAADA
ncbi:NAD(P)-binding protein [Thozetella sp. PMI_491]|nr:NAD(P)-binding protein [Thozetella sp. PMI_491]